MAGIRYHKMIIDDDLLPSVDLSFVRYNDADFLGWKFLKYLSALLLIQNATETVKGVNTVKEVRNGL